VGRSERTPCAQGGGFVLCSTNDATLRIIIVTGVRLYREGLSRMLANNQGLKVVGTASPREPLSELMVEAAPHVVLTDSETAINTDLCAVVFRTVPAAKVVAFAVSEENEEQILSCAQVGVCAFVPSDASVEELVDTVLGSSVDQARCSPRITAALIRGVAMAPAIPARGGELASLTQRERQVLQCVDGGLSNKETASELGISVITVKNHVHNLLGKLSLHRRGEAAALLRSRTVPPVRAVAAGGSRSF
jgi:DNA-binding NarL/FixJ family response regulator